jgi:hypothetical protein
MVVQKYKNIEDKKFYQAIKPDQTYKGLTYADMNETIILLLTSEGTILAILIILKVPLYPQVPLT